MVSAERLNSNLAVCALFLILTKPKRQTISLVHTILQRSTFFLQTNLEIFGKLKSDSNKVVPILLTIQIVYIKGRRMKLNNKCGET